MAYLGVVVEVPNAIVAAAAAAVCRFAWGVWLYNRLVRDGNLVREAWSGIDVQLKRRHDLIGNLVECVSAYSAHERKTLEEVTRLRAESADAPDVKSRQGSENALSLALGRLIAVAERYPNLKADRSFRDLERQLIALEDELQMARRYYNGAVRNFNIRVERFPGNIVAGVFGFAVEEFFEIANSTEREAPSVKV
jgi:LemA protein